MKEEASAMIKNGCPKKSPRSSAVIKNTLLLSNNKKWSFNEITLLFNSDKKLSSKAHFQDQAMIPQTSKKTFKRQILRSRCKNTTILE